MRRLETPEAITPQHPDRLAVGYVRLDEHPLAAWETAHREHQQDQVRHAKHWGWPAANILVLEDLGRCGCAASERTAYRQLLDMIHAGHVALVVVSDFDRLATCWDDVVEFLTLCRTTDTLVAVDGHLVDCADPLAILGLRLCCAHARNRRQEEALLAELEEAYTAIRAAR
ncbi:MAG: recombinase family protein [Candidatus Moduliflexus flocculans]|nr:recombinase family protein [Candidatus Moduliflexus flocculans]